MCMTAYKITFFADCIQKEEKLIHQHTHDQKRDETLSKAVDDSPSIESAEKKILEVVGAAENEVHIN